VARRWGYDVKGVAKDRAKVVVCGGNFHGRTITIISFSDDPSSYGGFGPYTPGFVQVPYGDVAALEAAIDDDTVAFLVEPIQGEAGIVVPGEGYLAAARRICTERDVLLIADEIQSGLGRTGTTFAVEHEGVVPDLFILGKALGGGIVPISAVVSRRDVLGVIHPGEHGSTFGGNPLAVAVGLEVLDILGEGTYQRASAELGASLIARLRAEAPDHVEEVRGRGLWVGIQMRAGGTKARAYCERLMDAGVLAKDTHETTIRLAPPLSISAEDLAWGADRLLETLSAPDLAR
ncbi:MAG: aspartate aminotransferase family protein, partial [Actinomycetota bacterium]